MIIITISRQEGSLGNEIAEKLSLRLNMPLIVREKVISEWMPEVAGDYELRMLSESPKFYTTHFKEGISFKEYIEKRLIETVVATPSIIVGLGAHIILEDNPEAIKVRITASDKVRIKRIKSKYGLGESEAEKLMQKSDRKHKRYISTLYGVDWADPLNYDFTLNTDRLEIEKCVGLIAFHAEAKSSIKLPNSVNDDKEYVQEKVLKKVDFKHPAEEEFANILDMYGIDWEYEPRTFPVQWDAEGNVTMAFSPDFYLTKFDTYLEITTMEQKYVTTKNKKVRKLRELYPGININIVYKKDFHSLLKRFGFSGGAEIDEFNRS